jgi:hypothetical protein
MNIGVATGALGSAAGAPLSQTAGAESERTKKEAGVQQRLADAQSKSEQAEGIGEMHQDEQASDRDADGRRLWEAAPEKKDKHDEPENANHQTKDPTGMTGGALDLTG